MNMLEHLSYLLVGNIIDHVGNYHLVMQVTVRFAGPETVSLGFSLSVK